MAIGGKTATTKYEGEKKFDIRIRYDKEYRKNENDILMLMIPTITGDRIPLKEIASIKELTGPAFIYRNDTKRFIGVKFSVRERDLGSTIAEAQKKVQAHVKLRPGYSIGWTGEFENQVRATHRLGAGCSPQSRAHLRIVVYHVRQHPRCSLCIDQRSLCADRWNPRVAYHGHQLWNIGWCRVHRVVWDLCTEWCDSHFGVSQSIED